MDRLSIILTLMSGAVLTEAFTITAFSLGHYSWFAVLPSAGLGYALSWPTAYAISRLTKRNDPTWDHTRADRTDAIPRINEPEM